MRLQLVMGLIVEAFGRGLLDRPVHALDLTMGPWMTNLGESMRNALHPTNTVKGDTPIAFRSLPFGELNAVVDQQGVNGVGRRLDQTAQEIPR
jgi:hypothetical protein